MMILKGVSLAAFAFASAAAVSQLGQGKVDLPDVRGGFPSDYIIVRFDRGVVPFNSPVFGPKTGRRNLDLLTEKWKVRSIDPMNPRPYGDEALADRLGLTRTYLVRVPRGSDVKSMQREYNAAANVEFAELDGIGGVALVPNDPSIGNCWGLNNTGQFGGTPDADIDAYEAWDIFTGFGNIILAVVDTGVDGNHPEMAGKMVPGWNTYLNNSDTMDRYSHGTHVAGTAGAHGNNAVGIAGVSWRVKIMPMKVLSDGGSGSEAQCGAGIVWAADNGANICTMSLQYYTGSSTFRDNVNYAWGRGVLLIAATGNSRGRIIAFPARFERCFAIGATNHLDQRPSWSNYGPEIDVVAPGENVYSLTPNNGYAYYSGTSMATPHTSGLASLLWSFDRGLSGDEVFEIIRATAEDKGSSGFDEFYGWGRINARFALDRALQDIAFPSSISLFRGTHTNGGPNEAKHSDDFYYAANGSMIPQALAPAIGVSVQGVSPKASPTKLQFLVETRVNKSNVTQTTQLFNVNTGAWETVDSRIATTTDNLVITDITSNPSRFIGSGNLVQGRISFFDRNPAAGALTMSLDQARWSVR